MSARQYKCRAGNKILQDRSLQSLLIEGKPKGSVTYRAHPEV